MRMRTKKWAKPELAVCPFYIKDAVSFKGKWQSLFKKEQPLWLELGCGKGSFLSQISVNNLDKNFLAVDLSSDMLGLAKRNVERAFTEKNISIDNVLLTWQNIERINGIIDEPVDRIFINFCNPWHKPSQYKKRLTHTRQLMNYRNFLKNDGEIHFKTDDDELFKHSVKYFNECGFEIKYITYDLHKTDYQPNYVTEHETMYSQQGIPIKFLIAVKGSIPVNDAASNESKTDH